MDEPQDEKPFWKVTEDKGYTPESDYKSVTLLATDDWGGGRTNYTWVINADTNGCFDINIPNHFCYGVEHLENMILALVEARNILIKQWDKKQQCNWNGKKWEIVMVKNKK